MKARQLTFGLFGWIVLNDSLDCVAQLLMKSGLAHTAVAAIHIDTALAFLGRCAASPLVWVGIAIYAFNFLTWIVILSRLDVSVAVPLASTNYVLLPFLAMLVLHEQVGPWRWAGILLIAAGIYCVSRSAPPEPQAAHP